MPCSSDLRVGVLPSFKDVSRNPFCVDSALAVRARRLYFTVRLATIFTIGSLHFQLVKQ
ncbi:hypothetical protein CANARDRAFT_114717 [[Candida] arabinofermentans NRRL YB-2248]|uniref:Uncharacterized protein n=1 Tax=[Candida] arabinofermentans NRRL YB-2248 TaxID=983967 RepID=A0A1E4T4S4_9ASCO|nr:hypothetical protein CANARDRAFT_114717 [[Candida] arabinofermentans NRRL YB-2248]